MIMHAAIVVTQKLNFFARGIAMLAKITTRDAIARVSIRCHRDRHGDRDEVVKP